MKPSTTGEITEIVKSLGLGEISRERFELECLRKLVESHRALRAETTAHDHVKMQLEKMAAENAGLNAFVDALLSIAWNGCSADGAEIQELALKHGLLRQETYSADEHENQVDDPGNFEDGDPVYFRVETPATDAFLAEVRAQGVEMLTAKLQVLIDEGNLKGDEIGLIAGAVYTGADIAANLRKDKSEGAKS